MDPKAAYDLMWQSFREGDYETALETAEGLSEWFDKGGFMPRGIPHIVGEVAHVIDQSRRAIARGE